jgi:predicted acyltransferase
MMDVRGYRRWAAFAVIVGMNPIFIYMFSNTVGSWFNDFVGIFTGGILGWTGTELTAVVTAFVVLGLEWYLCYWLYKRRIFIKI